MENYREHFIIASDNKICSYARTSSKQHARTRYAVIVVLSVVTKYLFTVLFVFQRYHDCMSMSSNNVEKTRSEITKHNIVCVRIFSLLRSSIFPFYFYFLRPFDTDFTIHIRSHFGIGKIDRIASTSAFRRSKLKSSCSGELFIIENICMDTDAH